MNIFILIILTTFVGCYNTRVQQLNIKNYNNFNMNKIGLKKINAELISYDNKENSLNERFQINIEMPNEFLLDVM